MVLTTMALFVLALVVNEALFSRLEFTRGIDWVYLPAGIRLISTLLFAEEGAVGLLLGSWLVNFLYFFQNDPARAFIGGILAAAAPYLVYRLARWLWRFQAALAGLTPLRLLALAVAYSISSPLLHHAWFAMRGDGNLVRGFIAMSLGDLSGTLIVLYGCKLLLAAYPRILRR